MSNYFSIVHLLMVTLIRVLWGFFLFDFTICITLKYSCFFLIENTNQTHLVSILLDQDSYVNSYAIMTLIFHL